MTFNQRRTSERHRALYLHAEREAEERDRQAAYTTQAPPWDPNTPSKSPDRLKTEWCLAANEAEREERRDAIREMIGHPVSDRLVERIIALSTGLEALYDLGEPQDAIICAYLRKHRDHDMHAMLDRATWVFVAK